MASNDGVNVRDGDSVADDENNLSYKPAAVTCLLMSVIYMVLMALFDRLLGTSAVQILVGSVQTLWTGVAVLLMVNSLIRSTAYRLSSLDGSVCRYSPLKHCNDEITDTKLRRCTNVVLAVLILGCLVIVTVMVIKSGQCLQNGVQYMFGFIGGVAEIIFVLLQTLFLLLSMTKSWHQCIYRFSGLQRVINVIIATDLTFVWCYAFRTYTDFEENNLSPFPNLKFCTNTSDQCDAYNKLRPTSFTLVSYSNTFEIEYFLFAMVTLSQFFHMDVVVDTSTDSRPKDVDPTKGSSRLVEVWLFVKKLCTVTIVFVSKHAFLLTTIFCILKLGSNIYVNQYQFNPTMPPCNWTNDEYISNNSTLNADVVDILVDLDSSLNYLTGSVAFIAAILTSNMRQVWRNMSHPHILMLLFVSTCHLSMMVVETAEFANARHYKYTDPHQSQMDVFVVFHFLGLLFQVYFLLCIIQHQGQLQTSTLRYVFMRGSIVFIGMCNLEKWIEDILFPPEIQTYLQEATEPSALFKIPQMWLIVKLLYPFICFYRLLTAVLYFRGYVLHKGS